MRTLFLVFLLTVSGCAFVPQGKNKVTPVERPTEVLQYYSTEDEAYTVSEISEKEVVQLKVKTIVLETGVGQAKIDYYNVNADSDNLLFVFPLLGGRNFVANHFAQHFAKHGFETAVIYRDSEFKKPENFDRLESIFRNNVIRDRVVLTYFENEHTKKEFGSFGISRGALNVAMTGGVDSRLKYNVLALGGENLPKVIEMTDERRLRRYVSSVAETKGISEQDVYVKLKEMLKTDPQYLAQYMNPDDTLLVVALLDSTVPVKYGLDLRDKLGKPDTVFLLAGHRSAALFAQFFEVLPYNEKYGLFPIDYIEAEALDFYKRSFGRENKNLKLLPIRILQAPFSFLIGLIDNVFN